MDCIVAFVLLVLKKVWASVRVYGRSCFCGLMIEGYIPGVRGFRVADIARRSNLTWRYYCGHWLLR